MTALGVEAKRIYFDHGLTGTNCARPGLREALAACRRGDTLVVTKLDRLARSVPDARNILEELTGHGVKLNIGGSVHDPADPVGRLLFTTLTMIAEYESDLIKIRTREGMAVARAKGRLNGKHRSCPPRKTVRGLVLRGQRRVHTTKESDPRRRRVVAALRDAGVKATIYDAHLNYVGDLAARSACLAALTADAAALGGGTLILERDDSLLAWDRRQLYRLARPLAGQIRYQHMRAADELLLCVPDAIAWCWAKGGNWRRRIEPLVEAVQPV